MHSSIAAASIAAFASLLFVLFGGEAIPTITPDAGLEQPRTEPALADLPLADAPSHDAVDLPASLVVIPEPAPLTPSPVRQARILHGACSDANWTCDRLRGALPDSLVAACAEGNATCEDGSVDWVGTGEQKADHLDAFFQNTAINEPAMTDQGNMLVGFSRGAFVARDVALARPGHYSAIVLIGASIALDPNALKAAGIRRVVLACGDLDSAAKSMQGNHTKLAAAGIETRFVSLGRAYHTLPEDTAQRLRPALAWASE